MRKAAHLITAASAVAVLLGSMTVMVPATANAADAKTIAEGKALAFNRKKGNCLACHQMDDGSLPGNIGPPLVAMKARFPDKAKLRAQIYDARKMNPNTVMPPFGPHEILTNDEIDKIVEYVYTL